MTTVDFQFSIQVSPFVKDEYLLLTLFRPGTECFGKDKQHLMFSKLENVSFMIFFEILKRHLQSSIKLCQIVEII